MCNPPAIAIALGVAQAGTTIIGQRQAAKTQQKVQEQASKQERERYLAEVTSMRIQERQEEVALSQRIQASTRKAREARATARVSAGEAGVAGLSVNALINDLTREEANYRFSEAQNQQMMDVNRILQLQGAGLGFTNNMLRINRPIAQPNYLGAVIGGVSTGLSAYSAAADAGIGTPKTPGTT